MLSTSGSPFCLFPVNSSELLFSTTRLLDALPVALPVAMALVFPELAFAAGAAREEVATSAVEADSQIVVEDGVAGNAEAKEGTAPTAEEDELGMAALGGGQMPRQLSR